VNAPGAALAVPTTKNATGGNADEKPVLTSAIGMADAGQ